MIEKTRKKQQRPCMHRICIQRMLPVLLFNFLLFFTTTISAQQCGNPAIHVAEFDIDADCAAATTVTHPVIPGSTYNLVVDPNITYTFTICDDVVGLDQPYAELWDRPGRNANFLAASTFENGCATITLSNCTSIQDYTIAIYTQHGLTDFCETNGGSYTLTSTCTPNTFTCPTADQKVTITSTNGCCFSGDITAPAITNIGCGTVTRSVEYTDCNGVSQTANVVNNVAEVEIPIGTNPVVWKINIDGVEVSSCPQSVIAIRNACAPTFDFSLSPSQCTYTFDASNTPNLCSELEYNIVVTAGGAIVPNNTIDYSHFSRVIQVTSTPTDPLLPSCTVTLNLPDGDTVSPTIECPIDIVLICGQSTDPDDTGTATGDDCAGAVAIDFDDDTVQQFNADGTCNGAITTRTWTARDLNGNVVSCDQTITLQPLDLTAGILCPQNFTGFPGAGPMLSCNDYSLTNLPTIEETGGLMTVNGILLQEDTDTHCGYIISKTDEIVQVCEGGFDILRKWKISNWCPPYEPFEDCVQVIKIRDTEGPIGDAGSISFRNEGNSCESTVTIGAASFTDGCSPTLNPTGYSVTLSGSGSTYSETMNATSATFVNVPMGVYNVTWCAEDNCEIEGCVAAPLTIVDNSNPIADCHDRMVTLNAGDNFENSFCTNYLNNGSVDNCSNDLSLLLKRTANPNDLFTECVLLSCEDINAPVEMTLQVIDNSGNVDTINCIATVTLDEPVCPDFPIIEINCNEDPIADVNWGIFTYANESPCNLIDFELGTPIAPSQCGGDTLQQTWISASTQFKCTQTVIINPLTWNDTGFVWPIDTILRYSDFDDVDNILSNENDLTGLLGAISSSLILSDIDESSLCTSSQLLSSAVSKRHDPINGSQCEFILNRTWKIVDNCSNEVFTSVQAITVQDDINPTLVGDLQDITVACGVNFSLPVITATDNVDDNPVVTWVSSTPIGDATGAPLTDPDGDGLISGAEGQYTVTFTATDECTNTDTASIIVTIDSPDPVLTCKLDSTTPIDLGSNCMITLNASDIFSATDPCNVGVDMAVQIVADTTNAPTTMPTSNSVTFEAQHIGEVHVQIWAAISGTIYGPQFCTFNVTDENCICTEGVGFELNGQIAAGCMLEGTVSNLTYNGVAAPSSDFTFAWPASTGCGNVPTCSTLVSGEAHVVTVTHNTFTGCSETSSVTVTKDLVTAIDINSVSGNCTTDENDISLNSFEFNGVETTDFTGFVIDVMFEDGTIVCPNLGDNICENQPSGLYTFQITTPNGCEAEVRRGLFCQDLRIGGTIQNEAGAEVDQVTVKVSDAIAPTFTDENGAYAFEGLTRGNNYTVTPNKNVDALNGVTTFDLVLISQHILGIADLDTPYKLIAADANNSGNITTLDLVKIQRLILRLDDDFAPVDSWCFVDAEYTFPTPANPFQSSYPEIFPITGIEEDMTAVDFIGVKIGDVNGTARANSYEQSVVRNDGTLNFEIQNQKYERGETVEVNFTSESFESMLGFQFTYQFDNAAMEFVAVKSSTLENLTAENFGLTKVADGLITASWFNPKAISLEKEDVLFTMIFNAKQSGDLSTAFEITSGITKNESYRTNNGAVETLTINLNVDGAIDNSEEVTLFQNSPNPFKESTTIQFYLPEADQAAILIFDYSGKLVAEINREFEKGMNEVLIDNETLKTTGVLFYQLETNQFTATKKMLLIE